MQKAEASFFFKFKRTFAISLLLFSLCVIPAISPSQNKKTDSLELIIKAGKQDTNQLNAILAYVLAGKLIKNNNFLPNAHQALYLSDKLNQPQKKLLLYVNIAIYHQGATHQLDSSEYYYNQTLILARQLKNYLQVGRAYTCLALVTSMISEKSTKIIPYYDSAISILRAQKNSYQLVEALSRKAEYFIETGKVTEGKKLLMESIAFEKKLPQKMPLMGISLKVTMGDLYTRTGQSDSAVILLKEALEEIKGNGNVTWESFLYSYIAKAYTAQNKFTEGIKNAEAGLQIAKENGLTKERLDNLSSLYELYKTKKDFEKALYYFELHRDFNDSLNASALEANSSRFESILKAEKKQEEINLLQKDKEVEAEKSKQQNLIMWFALGGVVLLVFFAFFMYNRFKITQKQKRVIEEQKVLVDEAFTKLHEKNKEVMDSINYASRIQRALLPAQKYIENNIKRLKDKTA